MVDLLGYLDYVLVYINNILLFQHHIKWRKTIKKKKEVVLQQLNDIGFRANLRKLFFTQKEVKYLRFSITSDGVKLQLKKVEVMNRMKPPTNSKELKRFLQMINFYRDLWPRRSHVLTPLYKLSSSTGNYTGNRENRNKKPLMKKKQCSWNLRY